MFPTNICNKYLQFPAQINGSLHTRTKNSVIPETSDIVFPINICNLVLYQTLNSHNVANHYIPKLQNYDPKNIKVLSKSSKNYHDGRQGRRKLGTLCCHGTTVHFSVVIDRESVLPGIFRGLCDVWNTLKSTTFVTDEQNTSSMGPPERPKKFVVVRIRSGSLRCT